MFDEIHRDEFKWPSCQEEMHVAPVKIRWTIPGTACAVMYSLIDVCSHMAPVKGFSESFLHSAMNGVF